VPRSHNVSAPRILRFAFAALLLPRRWAPWRTSEESANSRRATPLPKVCQNEMSFGCYAFMHFGRLADSSQGVARIEQPLLSAVLGSDLRVIGSNPTTHPGILLNSQRVARLE
jgi:hypothetical protein